MGEPILKWVGGKRQLLDRLLERFPQEYGSYHEPFIGGGAVFFALEPATATVNDTNARLINFYEQVRDAPEALIATAESFDAPEGPPDPDRPFAETLRDGSTPETYYYQQRAIYNRRPCGEAFDPLEEAALLLYLNRTGFNGLYRENGDGLFNAPQGSYTNPDWVRPRQVRSASAALQGAAVFNGDFSYVEEQATAGDLVYFDPPYEPMSRTASFTSYAADGFDADDQQRLLDLCERLDAAGVSVVLSNSGVMYDLYDAIGFAVEIEGATRAINSDASNRGEVDEIIATNVPAEDQQRALQARITEY